MPKLKISPSILSVDFADLKGELKKVSAADWLHIDIMDGHFVPNITIGSLVVKAIKKRINIPLDVHLMVESPERFISDFVAAGSDLLSVHIEAVKEKATDIIRQIKFLGAKAGIALNPQTPLSMIEQLFSEIDLVLLMSVQPGFGGQEFKEEVIDKIKQLREKWQGDIEIDGGINLSNFEKVVEAGASVLVAGSAIFRAKEPSEVIKEMRKG